MEYAYERQAMRGDELPTLNGIADNWMYLCLRNLYKAAKLGLVDREQGSREKRKLEPIYRQLAFEQDHIRKSAELFRRIESAATEVRKDVNAMQLACVRNLLAAIYKQ